jgi:hypothetical protein
MGARKESKTARKRTSNDEKEIKTAIKAQKFHHQQFQKRFQSFCRQTS